MDTLGLHPSADAGFLRGIWGHSGDALKLRRYLQVNLRRALETPRLWGSSLTGAFGA